MTIYDFLELRTAVFDVLSILAIFVATGLGMYYGAQYLFLLWKYRKVYKMSFRDKANIAMMLFFCLALIFCVKYLWPSFMNLINLLQQTFL